MYKKIISVSVMVAMVIAVAGVVCAQEEPMTQEQLAVQLVKNMKLQDQLPVAALPKDCVALLESLGISPLKGWDPKAPLSQDDYTVIIAKAVGREDIVHKKAAEICQAGRNIINAQWQKRPNVPLEELLGDRSVFPNGPPECPYNIKYVDKDKNGEVDPVYPPTVLIRR